MVSVQGARREMEDRYVLVAGEGGLFGGVYDGHGGDAAVRAVAAGLHPRFFEALASGRDPEAAFLQAHAAMDRQVRHRTCGTTATTFFLRAGRLTVANLGDGRLILVREGLVRALTRDHRVLDPLERPRILAAGGLIDGPYVFREDHGVMMSRGFGDVWFRAVGVIATPEVSAWDLTPADRCLVVASDGLWDELSNEAVDRIVSAVPGPQAAADALAAAVATRHGRDNLTVLVVPLSRPWR